MFPAATVYGANIAPRGKPIALEAEGIEDSGETPVGSQAGFEFSGVYKMDHLLQIVSREEYTHRI